MERACETSPSFRSRRRRSTQPRRGDRDADAVPGDHRGDRARRASTARDIGFTCSGSADYLTGGTFTFVQTLEATGAWPPISESHVEMDGAWALYEAWVRLQHGDIDVALVFSSGMLARAATCARCSRLQLDPYYLVPLWRRLRVARRAAGPGRARRATGRTERDLAEIVGPQPPRRASATRTPQVSRRLHRRRPARRADYVVAPLRAARHARRVRRRRRDRARRRRPGARGVRAPGVDRGHRPPRRPALPGRARPRRRRASTRLAGEHAGVGDGAGRGRRADAPRSATRSSILARRARASATTSRSTRRAARSSANPVMVTGPHPHRRGVPPDQRARQAPHARPRHVGPVPAAEPRLRARRRRT